MRTKWLLVTTSLLALSTAACGGDEAPASGPPPPNPGGNNAPPAAAPPPAAKAADPNAKKKVEDRVTTEEEKTIRHEFKERDFIATDDNRDPFQSFVLVPPELAAPEKSKQEVTPVCTRADQYVATTYSYSDLSLVGIIAERTQKRVLMMAGNFGYLIKKGDCVGREKALVKDIGAGYITFQVNPDTQGQAQVEEHSVQLYPNQVPLASQPRLLNDPVKSSTPVVAPGQDSGGAPAPSPPSPTPGTTVPVESPKN